jgi:hypothetical protein
MPSVHTYPEPDGVPVEPHARFGRRAEGGVRPAIRAPARQSWPPARALHLVERGVLEASPAGAQLVLDGAEAALQLGVGRARRRLAVDLEMAREVAFVRDVEQRALELAGDPLQVFRPVLHARGVIRSGRRSRSRRAGLGRPFEERDPGLRLIAGAAQLVELALQSADLRRVDEGGETERRRLTRLLDSSFQLLDRRAGQI